MAHVLETCLMPCPAGPKIFCACPNFLSKSKNLIVFSASSKNFVTKQKPNLLNRNHFLVWQKMFGTGKIVYKFLVRPKEIEIYKTFLST